MKNRILGRTGLSVSEIGLGSEAFVNQDDAFAQELINAALKAGVNYFDLYNPEPYIRSSFGRAMQGRRDKFILQAHLCSAWIDGQYKRTRDMGEVKAAFADLMDRLDTGYIDVGMVHYVDEQKDFDEVFSGEVIQFAKEQKALGKIRHLGMSTHNPRIAIPAAKTGFIDVIMFSVNPAYDILPPSEDVNVLFEKSTYEAPDALSSTDPDRLELYSLCESQGVALTVMKPYGGGALLKAGESPFGAAMTVIQCLHYCLTRPGVATVLCGAQSVEELLQAAAYSEAPEKEKDYAGLLSGCPAHPFTDKCMYCGHCAPCTAGIDIAAVNKFADLCAAQGMVPETVREHYAALSAKAGDCIACGACEERCPFGVKIIGHMERAKKLFGA
ncbi:aldo/keto reductase [Neglecta sp. X4]|uniref:aldo/keto reductase n=1 Tax=unclassified Neglectibacter TaxID=2632164 RepID=UPI00136A3377|nr:MULTISPECIES: aldo/keto reductase [unclassified Neglectibacter]NBI16760.1 aldo/keto reductase [Neglectibacter sp. 59]NBJ72175.1 aldo/keto reductase [Neglectibacter sp. X4]NCE80073.1 aldo/keto reductase [Neglectibacter sp. X58]